MRDVLKDLLLSQPVRQAGHIAMARATQIIDAGDQSAAESARKVIEYFGTIVRPFVESHGRTLDDPPEIVPASSDSQSQDSIFKALNVLGHAYEYLLPKEAPKSSAWYASTTTSYTQEALDQKIKEAEDRVRTECNKQHQEVVYKTKAAIDERFQTSMDRSR